MEANTSTTQDPTEKKTSSESDKTYEDKTSSETETVTVTEEEIEQTIVVLNAEAMEQRRQELLREIATFDCVGGNRFPEPRVPEELVLKLNQRRNDAIRRAKALREPFEKFQDFDSFIDDIIIDDDSWKNIQLK